jgi:hypothetical protein
MTLTQPTTKPKIKPPIHCKYCIVQHEIVNGNTVYQKEKEGYRDEHNVLRPRLGFRSTGRRMTTPILTEAAEQARNTTAHELESKFMAAIEATHAYIEHRTHCASPRAADLVATPVCVTCADKRRTAMAARTDYKKTLQEIIG